MLSHKEARAIICEAYRLRFGVEPSLTQAQLLQAVGFLETSYSSGWSKTVPGAAGSHNWGAITAGSGWSGATFDHKDSRPDAKGNNVWYVTKFRSYPTLIAGAADLARVVYQERPTVLAAATDGDVRGFSAAMYATKYYLGFGATVAERIDHHYKAVVGACKKMVLEIGEPMPGDTIPSPSMPAPRGTDGAVQHAINSLIMKHLVEHDAPKILTVDGIIGPRTTAAIVWAQRKLGVPVNGIADDETQKALGL